MEIYQNPYAGRQHEEDDQGFPWWDEAPVQAPTPEWGVCPFCGADSLQGVCTYDLEHCH